jgi:3-oxoacyl-[acyl-carrier-protein] synthase-3
MGATIQHIEIHLPDKILTNEELATQLPGWDPEEIYQKVGIKQRHISGDHETALDMAQKVCEKLFLSYDKEQIDFILLCTQSPDHFLPTSACLLQKRLGMPDTVGALDFSLGCSGFVYGLATAKGLIAGGLASTVLLVTAETLSKHIHPRDKANRSLAGDAATACIIVKSDDDHIGEFVLGTEGNDKDMIVPNGACRHRYEVNPVEFTDKNGNIRTNNHYFMNGHEVFNFTMKKVPLLVNEVMAKNHLTLDTVDYFVFHQANKFIIDHLRKMSKIPSEKFYLNMENTGNTSSCTIPIALHDALGRKMIKKNDKVLLAGFGIGYSWAGTVITIPEL